MAPISSQAIEFPQDCYLNQNLVKCFVNLGHRMPVSKGNDLDIYWKDGKITTIKVLDKWEAGGHALVNQHTKGKITGYVYRAGSHFLVIETVDGNSMYFSYGD
jgi:hypothetical protein